MTTEAIAAAISAQTENDNNNRNLEFAYGVAQVAVGVILGEKAYDEYTDATDDLEALNIRRQVMAETIHAHRLGVTIPFQIGAMNTALSIPEYPPDYESLCGFFNDIAMSSRDAARDASSSYSALFCMSPSSCRRALDYSAGLSAVDSTYARGRFDERTEERLRQLRMDTIQSIHSGTFTNPSSVFGLIDSAASVYGYIQEQAFNNLTGATTLLSYGASGLFSAISS